MIDAMKFAYALLAPWGLVIFGWMFVCVLVGRSLYKRGKSARLSSLVGIALFLLLFWDLIPGLALYSRYVRDLAGVRVFKTVEADGYLDNWGIGPFEHGVGMLNTPSYPYTYYEFSNKKGAIASSFLEGFGYWELRLVDEGRPECAPFDAWFGAEDFRRRTGIVDECVVAVLRDQPLSRYQREESLFEPLPGPRWLPKVYGQYHRIVDRTNGEVLGQAYVIKYASWMSSTKNPFNFLVWSQDHKDGEVEHILSVSDVVKPISARERP